MDDLEKFIIMDPLEWLGKHSCVSYESIWVATCKDAMEKYLSYGGVINAVDSVNESLSFVRGKKEERIIFDTIKFKNIIESAKKRFEVKLIVRKHTDRFFSIYNNLGYISYNPYYSYIYSYLADRNVDFLNSLVDALEARLKKSESQYLVTCGDIFALERATILACRNLGIKTINIQHGIYPSNIPLIDGKASDYFFVWGDYFKKMYTSQCAKSENSIYVLGYPYPLVVRNNHFLKKRLTIYYLGQNFEKYYPDLLQEKIDLLKSLNDACRQLGITFIYRPHPGDDVTLLTKSIPDILFSSKKESLDKVIDKGDIFIAFNSTSLVEAAIRSKLCIQIRNYPLPTDNFETLGICTKSFISVEEVTNYLVDLRNRYPDGFNIPKDCVGKFNDGYIWTPGSAGKRFLDLLDLIEEK
jgi:hypothetical protein